jgi:hypothetical protein
MIELCSQFKPLDDKEYMALLIKLMCEAMFNANHMVLVPHKMSHPMSQLVVMTMKVYISKISKKESILIYLFTKRTAPNCRGRYASNHALKETMIPNEFEDFEFAANHLGQRNVEMPTCSSTIQAA